eukprot:TRINITY_DN14097_c0_g1_i2.p2 TRINITY_DN14097_c0_g1~~TRINITY_DN14097_c0_g1_i2.p2  ORF type:complete len:176 (+),score=50.78 TRINITY_DN14097_c0_g1_i2:82-609(+)
MVHFIFYFFFFFQAEDGIRDAQESRGLGDVYKRQYQRRVREICCGTMTDPMERAQRFSRYCFTTKVKPDKLDEHKNYHDNIWPEVAGGLRKAGIKQLTTFQVPGTNQLVMYIETDGRIDLGGATGEGSEYRKSHPRCAEWEELMCSLFEDGEWNLMQEIHSSDQEWNTSLGLAPP